MSNGATCETCRFATKSKAMKGFLECRYDPPEVSPAQVHGVWPLCVDGDWCGKFAAAAPVAAEPAAA